MIRPTLSAAPAAMIAAASLVEREWEGCDRYRVTAVSSPDWRGSALLQVRASDGAEFYIGATRYGQTVHHEQADDCAALLAALVAEECKP
jgi:hypothetical protein